MPTLCVVKLDISQTVSNSCYLYLLLVSSETLFLLLIQIHSKLAVYHNNNGSQAISNLWRENWALRST